MHTHKILTHEHRQHAWVRLVGEKNYSAYSPAHNLVQT